jgi:hypothetical protein
MPPRSSSLEISSHGLGARTTISAGGSQRVESIRFEDDDRAGGGLRVGDRYLDARDPEAGRARRGAAMEQESRRSVEAGRQHLDVVPRQAVGETDAERLQRGFLRGEATGDVGGEPAPAARPRELALAIAEQAMEQSVAVTVETGHQPRDLDEVDSESDDHRNVL